MQDVMTEENISDLVNVQLEHGDGCVGAIDPALVGVLGSLFGEEIR